jgi:hypothetical protein
LIAEHGRAAFQRLIQMFCDNVSGAKIGQEFGVSRQRVSQWRAALGTEQVTYLVRHEIRDLVGPVDEKRPSGRRTLV